MPYPWPDRDVQRYIEKATAAMEGYPHGAGAELVIRFLRQLAAGTAKPPVQRCGHPVCLRRERVISLRTWLRHHSLPQLAWHVMAADDARFRRARRLRWEARRVAWGLVGWPRRRGDIRFVRGGRAWLGMRTK